jgi:hypothetical protein
MGPAIGTTRPVKVGASQVRHYVFARAFLQRKPKAKPKPKKVAMRARRSKARKSKAANRSR